MIEDFGGIRQNSSLGSQNRAQVQAIYDAVKDLAPDEKLRFRFVLDEKD